LKSLAPETLKVIANEIPSPKLEFNKVKGGVNILDLLAEGTDICASKSEARRAVKNNAISLNKVKITDDSLTVGQDDILNGGYIMIENGKKNKFLISLKD